MPSNPQETNDEIKAKAHFVLDELFRTALNRKWYGEIQVNISVQDGIGQHVTKNVRQVEKIEK